MEAGHYVFATSEAKVVRALIDDDAAGWTITGMTRYSPIGWATNAIARLITVPIL